ncbi:MAG: hypothetical protein QM504_05405 [Pseudomonadota bacterium]
MSTVLMIDKQVNFLGYDCDIKLHEYTANKQRAIELVIADTDLNHEKDKDLIAGEPMCMATVCMSHYVFDKHETAIKNYSENEGILDILIDAGIIELADKFINSGFITVPVVRLTL